MYEVEVLLTLNASVIRTLQSTVWNWLSDFDTFLKKNMIEFLVITDQTVAFQIDNWTGLIRTNVFQLFTSVGNDIEEKSLTSVTKLTLEFIFLKRVPIDTLARAVTENESPRTHLSGESSYPALWNPTAS